MKQFIKGAAIAPIFAPICFYIGAFILQLVKGRLGSDLMEWLIYGPIMILGWGLIIGYPAMFLLGLPYVYYLQSRNILSLELVCAGAVLLGAFASIVLAYLIDFANSLLLVALSSAMSLVSAYAFCRIERIPRFKTTTLNQKS